MSGGIDGRARHEMSFHTVFTTTGNRAVIDDNVSEWMREVFDQVKGDLPIEVVEWEAAPDHVSVTAKVEGIMSGLPAVLRRFRAESNRLMVTEFPQVARKMGGEPFLQENNYMTKMEEGQG